MTDEETLFSVFYFPGCNHELNQRGTIPAVGGRVGFDGSSGRHRRSQAATVGQKAQTKTTARRLLAGQSPGRRVRTALPRPTAAAAAGVSRTQTTLPTMGRKRRWLPATSRSMVEPVQRCHRPERFTTPAPALRVYGQHQRQREFSTYFRWQ